MQARGRMRMRPSSPSKASCHPGQTPCPSLPTASASPGKVAAMDSFDAHRRRELRASPPLGERRPLREGEALEQRLDRWMEAGRQLVEGVSGSRPGSRPAGRRPEGRPIARRGIDGLGRWVEERLDWLIDDGDDWREPWQEGETSPRSGPPQAAAGSAARRSRRPLEARSRRGSSPGPTGPLVRAPLQRPSLQDPAAATAAAGPDRNGDWPTDDSFVVPRWRRSAPAPSPASLAPASAAAAAPTTVPAALPTSPSLPAAASPPASGPTSAPWSRPASSPPPAQPARRETPAERSESTVERRDPPARPLPRSSRRR